MEELKSKLKQLYPQNYKKTYQEILKLTKSFKKKHPNLNTNKGPIFTERDIMLICYADHVQEPGVKTLRTMHKFLNKYAKGIINKIHFLPFYPWTSDDGFSVQNYYKINKPYGNWADLKKINKNFDFMFDLVLNHASIQSDIAQKQIAGDPKYQDFFIILDKLIDTSQVFRPRTHPLLTPVNTKSGTKYAWTTFSEDQVDWNYKNPEVLLEMIKILLFYFENGAKAIRLDAVAYCWKDLESSCFDLKEDHLLVQIFRDIFRKVAPHAWAIAETVLPHEKNIKYFGDRHNESHFVYNFALETLLLHTFLSQDTTVANKFLNNIVNDLGDQTNILNLSVSHDGVHVIPAKGVLSNKQMMAVAKDSEKRGGKVLYRSISGGEKPYELNITYPSAIGGINKYLASQAIQLALKGVPLIYLNNLIGAENWTEGVKKLGSSRAINRQKFNYDILVEELSDPNSKKYKIHHGYAKLLKARISEPLFSPLANQKIININKNVLATHRYRGDKSLIAITNVSNKKLNIPIPKIKTILKKPKVTNIINHKKYSMSGSLAILPYETLWLK